MVLGVFRSQRDTFAGHASPGTQLWGYEASGSGSARILEYDIGADVAGPTCVPPQSDNGRGIAFDPADGNLWYPLRQIRPSARVVALARPLYCTSPWLPELS